MQPYHSKSATFVIALAFISVPAITLAASNLKATSAITQDTNSASTVIEVRVLDPEQKRKILSKVAKAFDAGINAIENIIDSTPLNEEQVQALHTVSNVLKTKHDTVKNSINNVR